MKRSVLKRPSTKTKRASSRGVSSRGVLALKTHGLKSLVTTIGYRVAGIASADSRTSDLVQLKEIMGGKGAGLSVMSRLKIAIPPAFNLSTSLCNHYLKKKTIPDSILKEMKMALKGLEKSMSREFGSVEAPLLLSVRSGARVSMPGMMDTILNLGLTDQIAQSLARQNPDNARFWWDCYRRLIQMFSEVVLDVDASTFEQLLSLAKQKQGVFADSELSADSLRKLCADYHSAIAQLGKSFPQDPWTQLVLATEAVFKSWNSERAVHYREIHRYPADWGTSVTIQAMVFGNLNDRSGTGVVFTRDPSTGKKELYGEYLLNAQGEDVVAGIRTPLPIEQLGQAMPQVMKELTEVLRRLEKHFRDAQDVEFTIENGRLFILQTRTAKRSARASLENVLQFVKEKEISTEEALTRMSFDHVRQLLHPTLKATTAQPFVRGLAASPGAASGKAAFDPDSALSMTRSGSRVILIRRETSPEDIMGMSVSEGILTATGGMTSHAAVVARGMGKCCVVGCSDLRVDEAQHQAIAGDVTIKSGDWITLNGSTGEVYLGDLPTQPMTWGSSASSFFSWADKIAEIPVYANADTPEQASQALELGAQGIGLCRTEHMFFDRERIHKFRLMILSEYDQERELAAEGLLAYQRQDFREILKAMDGFPVTVRLLDPPLHEFLPSIEDETAISNLAVDLKTTSSRLVQRIFQLRETNPMLGHRGCRLGITFPEIYEMQVRALAQALDDHLRDGGRGLLKVMIPLTMTAKELEYLLLRLKEVFVRSSAELSRGDRSHHRLMLNHVRWGTMIELPRACLIAKQIAPLVDFVSFGTNDLTQTTFGISRDDAAKFVPTYLEKGLLATDPFETLDLEGAGRLIEMAVREGRTVNPQLEVGVCGEHGGDPESLKFFAMNRFSSVSCSPFRVPIARLAVARCALDTQRLKRKKR